jgi:hypothetical protein
VAFAYPPSPITSPAAERSKELARLAYELLDAHYDTERLVHERSSQLQWRAHLGYLRDLQRVGRQILAQQADVSAVRARRPAARMSQPGTGSE